MPLYYDTSSPSPSTRNTITRTATEFGIRDFLLHRNIQNPIKYPQYSTSVNGGPKGGEPVLDTMVGDGSVAEQVPIQTDVVFRYGNAVLMNHYKDTNTLAPELFDIETISTTPIFPTSPSGVADYTQEDITKYGLLPKSDSKDYRKKSTIKNLYLDSDQQKDAADYISLQPQQTAQQLPSYLDEYGNLNLGNSGGVRAADVLGSVLNGGLGFENGGIAANFDIRASLAGRVLTATGLLNDTKLGVIGGQQLALSLANNAAFNTQQLLLGTLNASDNILGLVKDGNLAGFRPDYRITIAGGVGGTILNYAEKILGFNVPRSFLSESGSLFSSENGNITNVQRANNMIQNTGKGQVKALLANVLANINGTDSIYDSPDSNFSPFRSGYVPGYKNNKNELMVNPKGYLFMDADGNISNFIGSVTKENPIPEISYNRSKMITDQGFIGFEDDYNTYSVNDGRAFATKFAWTSGNDDAINSTETIDTGSDFQLYDEFVGDKKTLLAKTQKLFNSVGMRNIIAVKGDSQVTIKTQIQSAVSPNGFISRGSGVISGNKFSANGTFISSTADTAENTFCRSWTPYNRYDTVEKLIRHRGLNQNEDGGDQIKTGSKTGGWRQNTLGSVLDDNGFVKVTPYKGDNLTRQASTPKKYMFSIENLAWAGTPAVNLLPVEQGPGDLLTGKFGRIMWFPPYDMNFSETSSVNLESTNFIGRGEPMYTYNNTERTGNLSFKIIIDHPTIMNAFAGDNAVEDEYINSYFAGCTDLNEAWENKLTGIERSYTEVQNVKEVPVVVLPKAPALPTNFKIYFKNDCVDVDATYEAAVAGSAGIAPYSSILLDYKKQANGKCIKQKNTKIWNDIKSYGLNRTPISIGTSYNDAWIASDFRTKLSEYLNGPDFTDYTINITVGGYASKQGCDEQNTILATRRAENTKLWLTEILGKGSNNNITIRALGKGEHGPELTAGVQEWEKKPKESRFAMVSFSIDATKTQTQTPRTTSLNNTTTTQVLTQQIKNRFYTESDFFEKLTDESPLVFDKIREKIKYFHPAFHSTTPEGFNSRLTFLLQCTRQGPTIAGVEPKNLAFGPQPVCILRVGDFYNTKIMIDNMSFDFEPLVWDLNPEGIGVQPMIANVTMSFKFIGASSLYGPINKLQNALSFNYFANTHVYDARADYIAKINDIAGSTQSKDRKTFGDTSSNGKREDNYGLVVGMDNGGQTKVTKNEVTPTVNPTPTNNPSQVQKNEDIKTPASTPVTTDKDKTIQVSIIPNVLHVTTGTESFTGTLNLSITVAQGLAKSYPMQVEIYDKNNAGTSLFVGTISTATTEQKFTVNINVTAPTFKFKTASIYQVKIKLIGLKDILKNVTIN